jgi:methionyl-tRNA synthetase
LAKEEGREQEVQDVCSVGINLFRVLITYLKPVLPKMAERAEQFLNMSVDWHELDSALCKHVLNDFTPLLQRVDPAQVEAMVEASKA